MLTISHKINTANSLSASDRLFCDNLYYEYLAAYNVLEALRVSYRNTHLPEKKYQDPFYHELRVLDKHCSELAATIADLNITYVAELEGHFTNAYHIPFTPYEIPEGCKHTKFEHYHDVVSNIITQTGTDLAAAGKKYITNEFKECLSLRSRIPSLCHTKIIFPNRFTTAPYCRSLQLDPDCKKLPKLLLALQLYYFNCNQLSEGDNNLMAELRSGIDTKKEYLCSGHKTILKFFNNQRVDVYFPDKAQASAFYEQFKPEAQEQE
jgi:hypothetical protein